MKQNLWMRFAGRRVLWAAAGALFFLSILPQASISDEPAMHPLATQPLVMDLTLDGEVEPVLATYIDEGLAEAAQKKATLALITMDTPGGLSDSMKDMIQHVLGSSVPVAVYVGPTGARG